MKITFLYLLFAWKLLGKWVILFGSGWIGLWWRRWRRTSLQRAKEGWPSVGGRILYGKVTAVPKTTKSLATITYSYFVEEFRSGTYDREFASEQDADEFVRNVKDREIQIRYKAANPDVSCPEASQIEGFAMAVISVRPRENALSRLVSRFRPAR